MILSAKNMSEISQLYDLGDVMSFRPISGGLSNYNFELKTKKGLYVVRFSSFEFSERRLSRLKIQISAIEFLIVNKFKYAVPRPKKSKNGEYVECLNDKPYWIYEKIEGDVYADLKKVDIKQLAKVMAEFHKIIEKMPVDGCLHCFDDYDELKKNIADTKILLATKTKKDKIDLFMENNLQFLENGFERIAKINFGNNRIFTHSDWFVSNFIFSDKKIVGLIDFDTYEIAPRIKDVACAIQLYCFTEDNAWDKDAAKIFLEEYERVYPLEKLDKYHLKDHIIRESCFAAVFFYMKNKKADAKKKLFLLNWCMESIRNMLADLEKGEYF